MVTATEHSDTFGAIVEAIERTDGIWSIDVTL